MGLYRGEVSNLPCYQQREGLVKGLLCLNEESSQQLQLALERDQTLCKEEMICI